MPHKDVFIVLRMQIQSLQHWWRKSKYGINQTESVKSIFCVSPRYRFCAIFDGLLD